MRYRIQPLHRVFILLLIMLLSACAPPPPPIQIPLAQYQRYQSRYLMHMLRINGANVFKIGEGFEIYLPARLIFYSQSANFSHHSGLLLEPTTLLLKLYETTSIKIDAYVYSQPTQQQNWALATRQAQVLASYLWSTGLDSRLVYTQGFGADVDMPGYLYDPLQEKDVLLLRIRYVPVNLPF